jgi:hypothetical protein
VTRRFGALRRDRRCRSRCSRAGSAPPARGPAPPPHRPRRESLRSSLPRWPRTRVARPIVTCRFCAEGRPLRGRPERPDLPGEKSLKSLRCVAAPGGQLQVRAAACHIIPGMNDLERERRAAASRATSASDRYSRLLYSTDASMYQMEPMGAESSRGTPTTCRRRRGREPARSAALPRGGGTSLTGQTVNHAVVLDSLAPHGGARGQPGGVVGAGAARPRRTS